MMRAFRTAAAALGCGLFLWGCISSSNQSGKSDANKTVALVNGRPITEADLLPAARAQLQQLETQEYQIKSQVLDGLIRSRLLEAEAKKKGLTVDQLIDQEVAPLVPEPKDAQLRAAYEAQKGAFKAPFDEVRDQIRRALRNSQIQKARQEYADFLRGRSDVSILLSPPRVQVGFDPGRVRGNPNAPVTIVEFSDFQCPYCKAAVPTLRKILEKYPTQVKLAYRDLPIRSHPHADSAAAAARCAGEQGKFWEYHDRLFEDQRKLDDDNLKEHARSLALNQQNFESCLASGKFREKIQEDHEKGFELGVSGTPGFFINGILISGAQPQAVFERIIDAELRSPVKTP